MGQTWARVDGAMRGWTSPPTKQAVRVGKAVTSQLATGPQREIPAPESAFEQALGRGSPYVAFLLHDRLMEPPSDFFLLGLFPFDPLNI
jgi:hypothetical protein